MSKDAPEYRGLVARNYDLLGGDTDPEELSFYRRRIEESGTPVLEIGCGTGRLLIELLAEGVDIDGVDNAPDMLRQCVINAAGRSLSVEGRLQLGAMQELRTERRYRTVLVPASTFQLLTSRSDQMSALLAFHAALESGGTLVLFVADLWPGDRVAAQQEQWRLRAEAPDEDGTLYRVWGRTRYDRDSKLDHDEERYERVVDDEVVEVESHASTMRWFSLEELERLLQEAGFAGVVAFDGFADHPAGPSTRTLHVVAHKPYRVGVS